VDWRSRVSRLQTATAAAEGHVNTQQAKRLRSELQAHAATADATHHLSTTLEKQPCGAAVLLRSRTPRGCLQQPPLAA
jgi:hypothetical protein